MSNNDILIRALGLTQMEEIESSVSSRERCNQITDEIMDRPVDLALSALREATRRAHDAEGKRKTLAKRNRSLTAALTVAAGYGALMTLIVAVMLWK